MGQFTFFDDLEDDGPFKFFDELDTEYFCEYDFGPTVRLTVTAISEQHLRNGVRLWLDGPIFRNIIAWKVTNGEKIMLDLSAELACHNVPICHKCNKSLREEGHFLDEVYHEWVCHREKRNAKRRKLKKTTRRSY